jgi:PAT family beta-lactamase induction signal transducer AmpG
MILSGGFALLLAQWYGFPFAYRAMGFLMLVGIVTICCSKEPSVGTTPPTTLRAAFIEPVRNLLQRPNATSLFLFILFYKLGESFTIMTSGIVVPFLIQGIGFSLETIAYVNKILGIAGIILGGVVAGFLLLRWSLYRALMVFGLVQALTNGLFVLLAIRGKDVALLALAVISDNFAAGMGSTALVALFMRLVDHRFTATQLGLMVAVSTLPRVFSGPVGVYIQAHVGWVGLYQISCLLACGFIPWLIRIRAQVAGSVV